MKTCCNDGYACYDAGYASAILLLNLMPTRLTRHRTRMLSNTPLQVERASADHHINLTLLLQEHMLAFYKTFSDVKNEYYDGMII